MERLHLKYWYICFSFRLFCNIYESFFLMLKSRFYALYERSMVLIMRNLNEVVMSLVFSCILHRTGRNLPLPSVLHYLHPSN